MSTEPDMGGSSNETWVPCGVPVISTKDYTMYSEGSMLLGSPSSGNHHIKPKALNPHS